MDNVSLSLYHFIQLLEVNADSHFVWLLWCCVHWSAPWGWLFFFLITPSLSILLSSLSTLGSNGIGTRRATFTWCGVAFSLILIFTGEVFINPVSPNTSGSILSSSMALGSLSNLRKPSAEASVRPINDVEIDRIFLIFEFRCRSEFSVALDLSTSTRQGV